MATADEKFRIWDAYWRDNRLVSAGVDIDQQIADTLDQQWVGLAAELPPEAKVLDLACGNGAASLALLRGAQQAGSKISISAIDSAAIDPPRYLPEHAELMRDIEFRPMTRMESLPYGFENFDVVISQFGIEYGNTREILEEVLRVLKPSGLLALLILPARSFAVHAAHRNLKQCRYLLREAKLFDLAIDAARKLNEAERATPEANNGVLLYPFNIEVEQVVRRFGPEECDVVLAMVLGLQKVFITRKTTTLEEQTVAIQTLRTRLAEYAARSQSLSRAAVSDAGLEDLKRAIAASGFKLTGSNPVLAGRYGSVAWRVTAERPAAA